MKALRLTVIALAATLMAVLALTGALWGWGGTETSLATSLEQLARVLPGTQTLQVKDVNGSLRQGGTIGWLRWQQGELSVEASDVHVGWTLRALMDGQLRLSQLTVRHLRIDDRRPSAPPTPPTNLQWPLQVDAPFAVNTLEWAGATSLQITDLAGHYIFDSYSHLLHKGQAHISSGKYSIQGQLKATTPMALSVQVDGTVTTTLASSQQPLTLQAHAQVQGRLGGPDATLEVQGDITPENALAPLKAASTHKRMQASISATLHPWQVQPVTQASANWQALDLATLWPQAPQTQLDGNAAVTPAGTGWQARIQLANTLSGPWDKQRLPVDDLDARVIFQTGQWTVESLKATAAGGRIKAQGQLARAQDHATSPLASPSWQGQATVQGINPAALDSRLAVTALDGQLAARQTLSGIAFETRLQPAARPTAGPVKGLRLKTAHAKGRWQAPLLTLENLLIQTDDAQLQGQLTLHTRTSATQGKLALTLPGATAGLDGHLARTEGQGEIHLRVADAALTSRWLQRWPGAVLPWAAASIQGQAEVTGQWQGGWQRQGQELKIQAALRAPRLDLQNATRPTDQDWHLQDLQADLSGHLNALSLTARGQADNATRHLTLQAQAQGGQVNAETWQARVTTLQLTAEDRQHPGVWTLRSNDSIALHWKQNGTLRTLDVAPGAAQLSGPVPGTSTVSWQAAHWSSQPTASTARTQWRTQGSVQGLPLAWLDLLGQTQMTNLGLRGDLLLGGQWDATGGDTLHLRASLERTVGDLQLLSDDAGSVRAGVRAARLSLTADGDQLSASLRWDSERAGRAQADFSTRLQQVEGAWRWPADAPVTGTVSADLPRVGAWSLLAPPGWRLRGTLNAQATLSGRRDAPQWRGTLQAREMAVRSVVDGIDFSQGTLRASLDGQRLDITQFTLQGADGSSGGLLSIKGAVVWLPPVAPAASLASRLHMNLEATAQALRISARADRRLAVSGQLNAQLDNEQLIIRGALKADQALFILPDNTAPQLGDDVLVRSNRTSPTLAATPSRKTGILIQPDVAVTLDLGPDFQVSGRGLITRLAGHLALRSTAGPALVPHLTGELRTVRGTYKAYGQQLDIEEGVLRFAGPFDNPALDILAIRPNLQQRVGVQISGTAQSPVVRLYAEPELPDAEKLAWLVLGRSAANGGAEAAVLQQAALALLGSKGQGLSGGLAQALGLDELSMRGGASNTDGTAAGATVTLGKRVSRDFYVAYERGLTGTLGTFYIFYDLSRRFTLRAQTGEQSAVDLIFTLRYD